MFEVFSGYTISNEFFPKQSRCNGHLPNTVIEDELSYSYV